MMKNSYRLLFMLVAFLLYPSLQPITYAQQPNNPIVMQVSDHLAFYQLQADGQLTPVGALPTAIGLYDHLDAEWLIPIYSYIVPSPDGQYIAFAAFNRVTDENALFLYSVLQNTLKQVELPGLGFLYWSPSSDGIVISRGEYLDIATSIEGVYVYDLPADTLLALTPEDGSSGPILWLPDDQRIVYSGPVVERDCELCVLVSDLVVVSRTGENRHTLTDLRTQISPGINVTYDYCFPSDVKWDNQQQRIFYSLGCSTIDERRLDLVHSVSLNADNRLEARLESFFPNDTYGVITDVFPVDNRTYITVRGFALPVISGIPDGYGAARLLRVDQPNVVTIVQEQNFDTYLYRSMIQAELSSDQRHIVFIGYDVGHDTVGMDDGYVVVYDLSSGQIAAEKRTDEQVCSVEWVDNDHFVYTEFPESQCAPHLAPGNTYLFDLRTNQEQTINQPDALLWVLSKP